MTNLEFVNRLLKAKESKTLYVMGAFGAPLTENNKSRYIKNYDYNSKSSRANKINSASADTFAFDCVCFVKGILWGWDADKDAIYGGAKYASNGVPDATIRMLLNSHCTEVTNDFSKIEVGEFIVMDGHCGVYIGNGMAVEATPAWEDGVQITEVWNISKTTSRGRFWVSHGKLKVVDYVKPVDNSDVLVFMPDNSKDEEISAVKTAIKSLGHSVKVYVGKEVN